MGHFKTREMSEMSTAKVPETSRALPAPKTVQFASETKHDWKCRCCGACAGLMFIVFVVVGVFVAVSFRSEANLWAMEVKELKSQLRGMNVSTMMEPNKTMEQIQHRAVLAAQAEVSEISNKAHADLAREKFALKRQAEINSVLKAQVRVQVNKLLNKTSAQVHLADMNATLAQLNASLASSEMSAYSSLFRVTVVGAIVLLMVTGFGWYLHVQDTDTKAHKRGQDDLRKELESKGQSGLSTSLLDESRPKSGD